MTYITYTETGEYFTLEVRGHAGYAEYGNDIVCSAISILVQTLMAHMEKVAKDHDFKAEPGNVWIWAEGKKAVEAAHVMITGFSLLEESFPDYVWFSQKGVLTNPYDVCNNEY